LRAGSEGEAVQELQVPFLFYFFGVNYEEWYRLIEFICYDFAIFVLQQESFAKIGVLLGWRRHGVL
jgi:hypothetical protein